MKQGILDRFEGTIVVVLIEDVPFDLPRSKLPPGIHEGDYLQVEISDGEIVPVLSTSSRSRCSSPSSVSRRPKTKRIGRRRLRRMWSEGQAGKAVPIELVSIAYSKRNSPDAE